MVRAAIDLLNTVGIQGTTMVAIGEMAGYSRGLATHHFGSKSGLFRTVLKQVSAAWTEELVSNLKGQTGISAMTTAVESHLAHALRHPDYIRAQNILWGAALDPSSEFKPNVADFMKIQRESVGISNQWLVSPDFDLAAAYEDFKKNMVRLLSATDTEER